MNKQSKEMAKLAYQALSEKKAEDIRIIDISEISVIACLLYTSDAADE